MKFLSEPTITYGTLTQNDDQYEQIITVSGTVKYLGSKKEFSQQYTIYSPRLEGENVYLPAWDEDRIIANAVENGTSCKQSFFVRISQPFEESAYSDIVTVIVTNGVVSVPMTLCKLQYWYDWEASCDSDVIRNFDQFLHLETVEKMVNHYWRNDPDRDDTEASYVYGLWNDYRTWYGEVIVAFRQGEGYTLVPIENQERLTDSEWEEFNRRRDELEAECGSI